uniref:Uncharacterized protein n=1 Tax=Siphoviridae sp. ctfW121 TaxID=2826413 RepID=A0A8S5N866_9CAUD|nr:MAG TPA: hypothetical protein [Siphoviridae sp. ctfW121]DAQ59074.1 MAG TPA: hypothetical protein [Caudoviricetes sp.]
MAKIIADIDDSVLKDISYIDKQFDHIFGGMTKAGAEVVYKNVISALPEPLRSSGFSSHVKLSKVYKTPSDDGINTKVMITGYFINKDGRKTPAPLVANMFEYGSDKRNYPKQPFFRKSFKKSQIKKAMEEAQKNLSGGLLDE